MKLLIITQKVDRSDPVLGFFHNWLSKFSSNFEKINVICLGKGEVDLPENVSVHSLGKQNIVPHNSYLITRLKYTWNFYKYIWQFRNEYDAVFVHMNQEYVLLGGIFWKLFGKKIYLWRNHPKGSFLTKIAVWFSLKVFYTSPKSFTAQFKKGVLMPVGIDTEKFKSQKSNLKNQNSILSLGRISPIKNIDKLIDAAVLLDQRGMDFVLDIVGDPVNPEDKSYQESLNKKAENLVVKNKVQFLPAVDQEKAAFMYQSHQIFVNLTPSGSMDKTILEAICCGSILVVVNEYYKGVEGAVVTGLSDVEISENLEKVLNMDKERIEAVQNSLGQYVVLNHSLSALTDKLTQEIKNVQK